MRKIQLHWKIIIGMILGILFGFFAILLKQDSLIINWIKPFGVIFINLLKLIAVPLVFASLIKGISSLNNISKLSKIGSYSVFFYLISTIIAINIGLITVNLLKPGDYFSQLKKTEFRKKYASDTDKKLSIANKVKNNSPLQFLVDIVPENIIESSSKNKNMLQVIFFAIIFGVSIILLSEKETLYVRGFIDGLNDIILKMIDLIMSFAPIGVFSLLASLIVDFSDGNLNNLFELFSALGLYSLCVIIGLFLMIFLIYPLFLKLFTNIKYFEFFKGIFPAQMLAFSTSSSAATLPITMDSCEKKLNISKQICSFVLPLGATINMDGTSLYQAIAAVFIAQAFGIDLSISQQITIVLTATLASIGAAAVPGAGLVMLIIVLESIGVNPEGVSLIFAVDRILDMLRTVVNVTGDATIAKIIDAKTNDLD
ncbi:MAG: dicarboxylate/amino acid:cation symporter [Flavobacteriales bacterium]|nr:dicarboxylate/amino acid:cation symporter [Flavobacteriales bacterium]|tara:strand:+ start:3019 stop:4299 length:1281 start_codon:yes stop_codon:yes gene_type:complete